MLSRSVKIQLGVLLAVFCASFAFAQVNPLRMTVSGPATGNVGTNIQYTITLTNLTPNAFNVSVTNIFPSPQLTFISGNPTPASSASGMVVFSTLLQPLQQTQFTLTLRPTVAGRFTNFVVAATAGQVLANDVIATTISGSGGGGSEGGDLIVSITPPPTSPTIFVDDWVNYSITVSKPGSGSMSGVVVTNTISPDAIFRRFSAGGSVSGSTLRFNLGTLSLQSTQLHVTVQPRTATNYVLRATVSSNSDTNPSNNSATNTFTVSNPVLGQLTTARSSDQQFNPQTGLV
ncbi:MAG TPA: hypothetical protein VK615_01255, partial [Candidatus Binatia bacterium]|nr:hypothetical protein [Candidatus Binatia bacterium]